MSRLTLRLCKACGNLHPLDAPWPAECRGHFGPSARSELAAPMFISDHAQPFRSMVDGQMYDSKSAYRHSLRNGERKYVEMGNDAPVSHGDYAGDRISKQQISDAVDMVKQGYKPAPLEHGIIPE